VYIEKGEDMGKPRKSKDGSLLARKPGKGPPCEAHGDCPKGHWSNPIEIKRRHAGLIEAYFQCRATGGRSLSEAEAADEVHLLALSRIDEVMRQGDVTYSANLMAASLGGLFSSKGGK
jgi:hypothetical protein